MSSKRYCSAGTGIIYVKCKAKKVTLWTISCLGKERKMSKAKAHTVVPKSHNVLSVVNTLRPGRLTNQLQYLENEVLEELWNHEYSGPFQVLVDPTSLPVRETMTETASFCFSFKICSIKLQHLCLAYESLIDFKITQDFVFFSFRFIIKSLKILWT